MTLRQRRKQQGLPLKVIALALDISIVTLSYMERGKRPIPKVYFEDGRAELWATLLGCGVSQLRAAIKEKV